MNLEPNYFHKRITRNKLYISTIYFTVATCIFYLYIEVFLYSTYNGGFLYYGEKYFFYPIVICLCLFYAWHAFYFYVFPNKDPVYQNIQRHGSLADALRLIEEDIKTTGNKFGKTIISSSWLVNFTYDDFIIREIIYLPDIVWVYVQIDPINDDSYSITSKAFFVVINTRDGGSSTIKCETELESRKVANHLCQRAQGAFCGYNTELSMLWVSDKSELIRLADKRKGH